MSEITFDDKDIWYEGWKIGVIDNTLPSSIIQEFKETAYAATGYREETETKIAGLEDEITDLEIKLGNVNDALGDHLE